MKETRDSFAPTLAHPALGARDAVGPYRLTGLLGGGGMGVVHSALDADGRPCAVKLLRPDLVDAKAARRFAREASVRVEHPNVIEVLGDGQTADGTPYIVFELLEGESLEKRLSRGALDVEHARAIGLQICAGLGAAHDAGVVHRDLKPANVFLCSDGVVKVLDFGIALLPSLPKVTQTGMVLGTPTYLSPEQARGVLDLDARTDVWSLGTVLYEMLSGRPPFASDSYLATLVAIALEPVPPLDGAVRGLSPALVALVHRCLAKDRDGRFPDARSVGLALGAIGDPDREAAWEASAPTLSLAARGIGIPAGEERIVVVLLADGVQDYAPVEKAIRDRGGEPVTRFRGSVLGLFGAESWVGDESARAVEAALEVRAHVGRIAVSSGRASASGDAGLAGAAVRSAERGCRRDVEGVALDASTAKTLETKFSLQLVSDGIFEVLGPRPPSWFAPKPAEHDAIVGRDVPIAQMRFALETVLSERRAMTVRVIGPTGAGKTAMRLELERAAEEAAEAIRVIVARAEPVYRETAWSFLASALQRRAATMATEAGWPRLDPSEPLDRRREVVARLAAEALDDPHRSLRCAEMLGEVLGVSMPSSERLLAARESPAAMADAIRLGCADWLLGLAGRGPVLLVLDDADFADAASLDVLAQVLDGLEDAPLLALTTARGAGQETGRATPSTRDAIQIELKGLPRAAVGELAAALAGRALPEHMVDALVERTEGNPLFVREVILGLAERGRVDGESIAAAPLPLSVEAAVQSRLDLLGPAERDLCRRASALGRPFSAATLEGIGVSGADALLAALRRRDVVVRHAGGAASREYRFRSSLLSDVSYNGIAKEARGALHREIARFLAGARAQDPEEVARHHDLAGEPGAAALRYADATLGAAARGDSASVLRCSERALTLGIPFTREHAVRMARAEALRFLGRKDEQLEELRVAHEVADGPAQRALALRQRCFWLCRAGRIDEALEVGAEAVAEADASADDAVRALTRCALAQASIFKGRLVEADAVLDAADALASDAGPVVRAQVAEWRALSAAMQGDPGRAQQFYASAVELYDRAGHVREKAANEQNLADAYNRMGAYDDAERALRQALEGCRRVGNRVGEAYALANLGYALTGSGRHADALESLDRAARLADEMRDARLAVAVRIYRARAHLSQGASAEIAQEAEAAAAGARTVGLPSLTVSGLALAARARLDTGALEAALELSSRALELRDELGGIEEDEAEVFLVRADALEAGGHRAEAQAVRGRGRARLRDVAERIVDASLRERFLQGVPVHGRLLGGA